MVNVRRGPRELEAQTSIKRGYLNLIHAREAFARGRSWPQDFDSRRRGPEAPRAAQRLNRVRDHTI